MTTPTTKPRLTPIQPPKGYHAGRRRLHLIFFLIFCALPFFDVIRFDIPRQRFYLLGQELWISEFGILFLTMMFLMFCIVALSMIMGRMWCSYACPQMIFSETSLAMESWLDRKTLKRFGNWSPLTRKVVSKTIFYGTGLVASMFLAFVFTSYFVEPVDLFHRLMHIDIATAGGITGAVVTLVTFADFAFLRQRFCTTVCPYGYLQGMLGDKNTLLVHYRDEKQQCIECKKCVRICHMGIDIRKSPLQIECIHCGECVDACNQVLARLGKPGLIQFAWGEKGQVLGAKEPWYRKIGIRDAKRAIVLALIYCYGAGLVVALSMRQPVFVRIEADRSVLYSKDASGGTVNLFRVVAGNRSKQPATVQLYLDGLAHGYIAGDTLIGLQPGEERTEKVAVTIPAGAESPEYVTHFRMQALTEPGNHGYSTDTTFIMPRGSGGK